MYMRFISKFSQKHYGFYINKINKFIGNHTSIDTWIKSMDDYDLNIWLYLVNIIETDSDEYYEETSILLTIIIKFFILELDIEDKVKLRNSFIKKLFNNFKYSIYREYSNRNDVMNKKIEEYHLI